MKKKMKSVLRLYTYAAFAAAVLLVLPGSASAQYQPRPINDPATGEAYHIEGGVGFWLPSANITIASEALGIPGTEIDAKKDLGLTDQRFPEFRLVARGGRSKFRFEFVPIKYEQNTTIARTIVFNGQAYQIGIPVASSLDWKALRFTYEFDFIQKNWGFAGFIVEAKYTDVNVQLTALSTQRPINEFAHAVAPIPAIGGIGRYYIVPNISVTGELTAFRLPDNVIENTNAHYVDFNIYGTVNFTNNIGAQLGYRSLDVGYLLKSDNGAMTLNGIYFGVVTRY